MSETPESVEGVGEWTPEVLRFRLRSEPLTYDRYAPHSFFRDMAVQDRDNQAKERLTRHWAEMDVELAAAEKRANR
jgi:hypothetical protein